MIGAVTPAANEGGGTKSGGSDGLPMDYPVEPLLKHGDDEVVVDITDRGASLPETSAQSRRSERTEGLTTGIMFRTTGQRCDERGAAVKDALGFLVGAARDLAGSSSIPFVPEIATLLSMLAGLCSDLDDNGKSMPKTVRWCESMLNILDKSNLHNVVNKVGVSTR